MQGIIPEDIIAIDVDKIDFSDNGAVKRLVQSAEDEIFSPSL